MINVTDSTESISAKCAQGYTQFDLLVKHLPVAKKAFILNINLVFVSVWFIKYWIR